MRLEHKKLGVSLDLPEMTQGEVEAFFRHTRESEVEPLKLTGPEYAGVVVRAAKACGWLNGIGEVESLKPAAVVWIAGKVNQAIAEALAVPPE